MSVRTIALVREVSPSIVDCELTHLDREPIDVDRARAQHAEYVAALEELGCRIRWIEPEPGLPDAVFVEDIALVLDELAVITHPGAEPRRPERASVATALHRDRELRRMEGPGTLDGGDVLHAGRTLYVGRTPRTTDEGADELRQILAPAGYEVRTVPVHGCLHLKSAVTVLDQRTLLINREWTDADAFGGFRLIDVDPGEPFAANALRVENTIIHPAEFPRTRARMERAGFNVRPVPASELAKAEGGVTCCSLLVRWALPRVV